MNDSYMDHYERLVERSAIVAEIIYSINLRIAARLASTAHDVEEALLNQNTHRQPEQ